MTEFSFDNPRLTQLWASYAASCASRGKLMTTISRNTCAATPAVIV